MKNLLWNKGSSKRIVLLIMLGATLALAQIQYIPIHNKMFCIGSISLGAILWSGLIILSWRKTNLRNILLFSPLIAMIPFLLPSRSIDRSELQENYIQQLRSYNYVPYVWGGENRQGIDCSGLPRKAMRNALLHYGLSNANGSAIRASAEHWWYDASAKALSSNYRSYTRPTNVSGTIRTINPNLLEAGDLAITDSGIHVLVYLSQEEWIQADPGAEQVITLSSTTSNNVWIDLPVSIYRWNLLGN